MQALLYNTGQSNEYSNYSAAIERLFVMHSATHLQLILNSLQQKLIQ